MGDSFGAVKPGFDKCWDREIEKLGCYTDVDLTLKFSKLLTKEQHDEFENVVKYIKENTDHRGQINAI